MQYQSLYFPVSLRAAWLGAKPYREAFNSNEVAAKPRGLTFEQSMHLRAEWLLGALPRELMSKYRITRFETVARILSGLAWVSPGAGEVSKFREIVAAFYNALDACDFGPLDAVEGTAVVLPMMTFLRGEYDVKAALEAKATEAKERNDQEDPEGEGHQRRYVGVTVRQERGLLAVRRCREGSPAYKAGIRANDILVSFNGWPLTTTRDWVTALAGVGVGDTFEVEVARDGETSVVKIVAGVFENKAEEPAPETPKKPLVTLYPVEVYRCDCGGAVKDHLERKPVEGKEFVKCIVCGQSWDKKQIDVVAIAARYAQWDAESAEWKRRQAKKAAEDPFV